MSLWKISRSDVQPVSRTNANLLSISSLSISSLPTTTAAALVAEPASQSSNLVVDSNKPAYYRWLIVISFAILYNLLMIVGRSTFWELQNNWTSTWIFLDYFCDFVYLIDIAVNARTGEHPPQSVLILFASNKLLAKQQDRKLL